MHLLLRLKGNCLSSTVVLSIKGVVHLVCSMRLVLEFDKFLMMFCTFDSANMAKALSDHGIQR